MRLNNLDTVLLCGVNVVRDVVTVLKRNGSNQAVAGIPATLLSHCHPSQGMQADTDCWPRYERPAFTSAGQGAPRAGRLASPAGVAVRLRPTSLAVRGVLSQKQGSPLFMRTRATLAGMMRRS
jgi:hypothetical protein